MYIRTQQTPMKTRCCLKFISVFTVYFDIYKYKPIKCLFKLLGSCSVKEYVVLIVVYGFLKL